MKRNKRGITLIALIITIIVLLILAGVTMSFVVGDNGVVTQAQKSRIRTDEASAKEEIEMEVAGSYNDKGLIDLTTLNENLKRKGGVLFTTEEKIEGEERVFTDLSEDNQIEKLPVTVKYKDSEVEITGEYTGGVDKSKTASQLTPQKDYGKFVDYGLDLNGDKNYKNDWKIFYTDEESGRIFLIAADYVPNTCEALQIAESEECAKMKQSTAEGYNKCCSFWDYGAAPVYDCYDGKSDLNKENHKVDGEDDKYEQCSLPEIFMLARENNKDEHTNNHYYCSSHVGSDGKNGKFNSMCASSLQCTTNWKSFVDKSSKSKYAEFAIGGPTLEMWVASWNQKYGTGKCDEGITLYANGNNDASDKSGYYIDTVDNNNSKSQSVKNCKVGYSDKLYFPHSSESDLNLFEENESPDEESEKAKCSGYWLASPAQGEGERSVNDNQQFRNYKQLGLY